MNEPFQSLVAFLEACHADVEGRGAEAVPAEMRPLLQALAVGKLPGPTRDELVETLKQNPQWVAHLASEAKRLRDRTADADLLNDRELPPDHSA